MQCENCGGVALSSTFVRKLNRYVYICRNCRKQIHISEIEEKLAKIQNAESFKGWDHRDMSDAFWHHLSKYQRCPNQRSLQIIKSAYHWACHDNGALANSFRHALEWCNINLKSESERQDLPLTEEI